MKTTSTLIIILAFLFPLSMQAQTVYTISSNTNWNGTFPSTCSNCIFNISAGKTLNINLAITCNTCTFNGGTIKITEDVICQPCAFSNNSISITNNMLKPNSGTTSFSGVTFTATGSANIFANSPVTITNSDFTFKGNSFFNNNGGALNMTSSSMSFTGSGYFLANAGPVNLITTSRLIAGDGSIGSAAYIKINGPALNLYDNSSVSLQNKNNYYFNWNSYNSMSNATSYSTSSNTLNCGGANPHACSAPNVYGCATLNSSGASACSILPVVLNSFSVKYLHDKVELSWAVGSELNFDHFTVERRAASNDWKSIGTVHAQYDISGGHYSFTDQTPEAGTNEYRLAMTDKDGATSYSVVAQVKTEPVSGQVSIFPNPLTDLNLNVKINSTDAAVISVYTMEGRKLYSTTLKGQLQYTVSLPSSTAAAHYLIVQVISKGQTHAFNIMNK